MKTTLYYFSGTGNSLKIAWDLAENIDGSELVSIVKVMNDENLVSTSEKVGFIFPLYYFGLPKIVNDFVNKIDLSISNYFFAIITRGGHEDGVPMIQLDNILKTKSKFLSSGYYILMPDNYILLANATPEEDQKKRFEQARKQIVDISEAVKKNKKQLEIDLNEKKIRRFERLNKKFHKDVYNSDTLFFADANCNNCGICEKICPANNIVLINGKPEWQHKCQQCLACINYCPEKSIQYGEKTKDRNRYHHPEVTVKDLVDQK